MLADADVLVRAALTEGLPNVALEAMSMRVPVVATGICGTPEAVLDGETGRLVPPGDEASFARALGDVLRDDLHARALGSRARSTVEASLTWDRYVERLRGHLDDAAAVPARPGSAGG